MRTSVIAITFSFLLVGGCESADTGGRNGSTGHGGRDLSLEWSGDGLPPAPEDDLSVDKDAHFIQDPPVMYCGLDGGMFPQPSPPGGTLACPDDKNLEGCPCPAEGMTAVCWPGRRANRNLGICMDGMTTCKQTLETVLTWGPCEGATLPNANATEGAEACECFSHGFWDIANVVPCGQYQGGTDPKVFTKGYSSTPSPMPTSDPTCHTGMAGSIWSKNTVTADCAGHFKLCITLKAGDVNSPKASDCVVGQSCATGDYLQVGVPQAWPDLPGWTTNNGTCVGSFYNGGGYAELSVEGFSITCDQLPNHVFQRFGYCKEGDPNCQNGGSGEF